MPDYTYTVNSSFQPFSMQEMLMPFTAYKDAYEKSEEEYNELSKSNTFEYLNDTLPEGSKSRQIYDNYANELSKQANDLSRNGLTMGNRRALTSLKRRYNGEIGRLMKADEAMDEERKLRRSLNAQDSSRLYAIDNLNIDDFLDGKNPNLYNISGNEIYSRAAQAGKAVSSRVFSTSEGQKLLNDYYIDLVQTNGLSQDTLDKFYEDTSSNPALKRALDDILEETGVNQNLTGVNLQRARKYALSGIMDGAIYQESHSPQRDLSKPTWAEERADYRAQQQFNLQKSQLDRQAAAIGYRVDDNGNMVVDPERMKAMKELKQSGKKTGNSQNGTQSSKAVIISWHGNNPNDLNGDADDDISSAPLKDSDGYPGKPTAYDSLPTFVKNKVDDAIGDSSIDDYDYYYQPFVAGILDDTEARIAIIPRKTGIKRDSTELDFGIHE